MKILLHILIFVLLTIVTQIGGIIYIIPEKGTKALAQLILKQKNVGKLFIEPHLKTRLNLTSKKVRFHGCKAVRHDDHIHFQLK